MNLVLLPLGVMACAGFLSLIDRTGLGSRAVGLPTLTLPGIAGIVLTAGMAVDANVLIFERMREEQRQGKRFAAVISNGYEKAFTAIFDSNLTTILAGVIISGSARAGARVRGDAFRGHHRQHGTRPSSVTAWCSSCSRDTTSSRGSGCSVDPRDEDRLHRHAAHGHRLLRRVIAVSAAVFAIRGKANLAWTSRAAPRPRSVRAEAAGGGHPRRRWARPACARRPSSTKREFGTAAARSARSTSKSRWRSRTGKGRAGRDGEIPRLQMVKQDNVGAQVGSMLQRNGILAVVISLVGMIIYISLRFEFGFSMGAVVALVHDAVVCVFVTCLFGRQLSMNSIAPC